MTPVALALITAALAAPPEGAAVFTAHAASGQDVTGVVTKFTAPGATLQLGGRDAGVADLLSLRRVGTLLPGFPAGSLLVTATGDRVPGRLTGGDGQSLSFRPRLGERTAPRDWAVPFPSVAAVWLTTPPADTPPDPARYAWRGDPAGDDVLLTNGDVVRGTLEGVTCQPAVVVKPAGGGVARTLPLVEVAAVAFNPALSRTRKPKRPFARSVLSNGTRLDLKGAAVEGGMLRGETLFGAAIAVPLTDLVGLDVLNGKATPLSDLKPKRIEPTAFLGLAWPTGRDRTSAGEPLRLATTDGVATFDRGVTCRPGTRITYTLGGKYRRFEAVLGLDAVIGRRGSAAFRVLLDGKDALPADARRLIPGKSFPVSIDVINAKEMTLVADFADGGDVLSEVDWADAKLVE